MTISVISIDTHKTHPAYDYMDRRYEAIAKAQLKKVVEYLGENGGLFVDKFDKKRFQMDYNIWQALLKEVE